MFSIRSAGASDLDTVRVLFREYAASLDVDLAYQGFEAELAGLPGAYAPPTGHLLLAAARDGEALGCVALRPLARMASGCEMKRLYARPVARGSGVGRAMVVAAIEAARGSGYRSMWLDTLATMTAAQGLYRALGFVTVPAYYDTPVAGTVFMCKTFD